MSTEDKPRVWSAGGGSRIWFCGMKHKYRHIGRFGCGFSVAEAYANWKAANP